MEEKIIHITCKGSSRLKIEELEPFQDKLKTLTEENYQKLRKSIETHGFSFPIFIWEKNKKSHKIIDGHQRLATVQRMIVDGWTVEEGKLPIDLIEAKSEKEAKAKVLLMQSRYSDISGQSLYDFMIGSDLDVKDLLSELRIPELDLDRFKIDFIEKPGDFLDGMINTGKDAGGDKHGGVSPPGETVEGENYLKLIYPVTESQRDIIMRATNLAKEKYSLNTSILALVQICKLFFEGLEKK